jgi:hypothetical protein
MRGTVLFSIAILMVVTAIPVFLTLSPAYAVPQNHPGTTCTVTGTNPGGHTITLTFRGSKAADTATRVQNGWIKAHFTGVTNSCA